MYFKVSARNCSYCNSDGVYSGFCSRQCADAAADSIDIGDILWDDTYRCFGYVVEKVEHEYPWVVQWDREVRNWVSTDTVIHYKNKVAKLNER